MSVLNQAYRAIQEHSILWTDPVIKEQIEANYLSATKLDPNDPTSQVAALIQNVSSHCLSMTTPGGDKVTPGGIEKNTLAPCINCQISEGKATLTLPHFEREKTTEWDTLYARMDEIKASREIVIDLRGNSGKNGVVADKFLTRLLGENYVKSRLNQVYQGASYKWRVSDLNRKALEEMNPPTEAYRRHRDDILEQMKTSQALAVSTQVPDYELPETPCDEPAFKGSIVLKVDEKTKGCAQTVIQVLEKHPHITIDGPRPPLQRFGEVLKIDLAGGRVLHVPRKEEVLKAT